MWWVDFLIIGLIILAAARGFMRGFLVELADLVALLLGVLAAAILYRPLAGFIDAHFRIIPPSARLLAFVVIWFAIQLIYFLTLKRQVLRLPERLHRAPVNAYGGLVLNATKAVIWMALGLMLFAALPLSAGQKEWLTGAALPRHLLAAASGWQGQFNQLIGANLDETLNFLSIRTKGEETIQLGFMTTRVKVDARAEQKMLDLVNYERTGRGLEALAMDPRLQDVARAHSRDMFARGYFSHITPEGKSPFDRMEAGGVYFFAAGENIALAPTVDIAHVGLMNSPGHRANILSTDYHKVGIGVIDGGPYGEMFTQDFTN